MMDDGDKKSSRFVRNLVRGMIVSLLGTGMLFLGFWLLYLGFLKPNPIWGVLGGITILMGMSVLVMGRRN